MKHLFVINSKSKEERANLKHIFEVIRTYFEINKHLDYSIFFTKSTRDALVYIRNFVHISSLPSNKLIP